MLYIVKEPDQTLYKPALESLRTQIRSSTTSMTSVPKPLKFLRQHYDTLKSIYETIKDEKTKVCLFVVSYLFGRDICYRSLLYNYKLKCLVYQGDCFSVHCTLEKNLCPCIHTQINTQTCTTHTYALNNAWLLYPQKCLNDSTFSRLFKF